MSSIRRRKRAKKDVYLVDFRDAQGLRRRLTAPTKEGAELLLADKITERRQAASPLNPDFKDVTVETYAKRWEKQIAETLTPETVASYVRTFRLYVLAGLRELKVREIHRGHVKELLLHHRSQGLSKGTVRLIKAAVSSLLGAAEDDRIVTVNAALQLGQGRKGRKGPDTMGAAERRRRVRPFSSSELRNVLATARTFEPRFADLFLVMARAGLRPGEARGLQWSDLDFGKRRITVERSLTISNRVKPTKTERARKVDMTPQLAEALQDLLVARKNEALELGAELPVWVFSAAGAPLRHDEADKALRRVCKLAELPGIHSCYDCRHSFASHLLSRGVPISYVAEMLGHSSAAITLSWYAHYLPDDTAQLADVLDEGGSSDSTRQRGTGTRTRHRLGTDPSEVLETADDRERELETTCEYPGGSRRL